MSITKVTYKKERPGLLYDSKLKVWIGYKVDVIVRGSRDRTSGFATRALAENYIESLTTKNI